MMKKYDSNSSAGELALQQGITAAQAGFNSLAVAQLERAADLSPDNAKVWLWLAWLANSPDSTRRCLNRVIELSPGHSAATAGLIWVSSLTGDWGQETAGRRHETAAEPSELGIVTNEIEEAPASVVSFVEVAADPIVTAPLEVDRSVELTIERTPQPIQRPVEVASPIAAEPPLSLPATVLDSDGWEIAPPAPTIMATADDAMASVALSALRTEPADSPDSMESRQRRWTDLVNLAAERPLPTRQVTSQDVEASLGSVTEFPLPAAPVVTPVAAVEMPEPVAVVQSRFTEVPAAARSEVPMSVRENIDLKARAGSLVRHQEAEPEISADIENLTQTFNPSTDVSAADDRPLVMVVDDSPTVRKLVSMTLERRGYRVISAFDGVAAIKELGTCRPDLILLDINMPRLDGYRLCKLIKKHEATQSIPVVMLSGKDGMFDKLRGRLVGCSDYITKPFEADALTHKVAKYLAAATANSL